MDEYEKIKLEVENYCHKCVNFSPVLTEEAYMMDNIRGFWHRTVICEHREKCKNIEKFIKNSQYGV